MPLNLQIVEDGHIVSIVITDPFGMKDLLDKNPMIKAHLDSTPFKVHTLVDLSGLKVIPGNALSGRSTPAMTHPNSGSVAIVGGSVFAQRIIEAAFKITGYDRVRFFKNTELAWAFLREAMGKASKS